VRAELVRYRHDDGSLRDGGADEVRTGTTASLSVKTVDHHVSAIPSKLQVTKRRDAVKRGRELGIVS
jgi:DNA-binding CsgD family transcriptional regulator